MKHKEYKAMVTDRHDGEKSMVVFKAKSKKDFIEQMGYNGYSVYYGLVEETDVYDWIMDNTNGDVEGWPTYRKMAIKAIKAEEV